MLTFTKINQTLNNPNTPRSDISAAPFSVERVGHTSVTLHQNIEISTQCNPKGKTRCRPNPSCNLVATFHFPLTPLIGNHCFLYICI